MDDSRRGSYLPLGITQHVTRTENNGGQVKPGFTKWKWVCICGESTDFKFNTKVEAQSAAYVHRKAKTS